MHSRSQLEINGWLISPQGNWCYCFHRDPKSWQRNPFVFVDKWSVQPDGSPLEMKGRRTLPLDEALELCGQMLLEGWQKVSHNINESKEVELTGEVAA